MLFLFYFLENQPTKYEDFVYYITDSLLFIDTTFCHMYESCPWDISINCNDGEVSLVVIIVDKLRRLGLKDSEIAVMSPFESQSNAIKMYLWTRPEQGNKFMCEISELNCVPSEKKVVIISMVTSQPDSDVSFLDYECNLDIAIRRSKTLCILIANSNVARNSAQSSEEQKVKVKKTLTQRRRKFHTRLFEYLEQHSFRREANGSLKDMQSKTPIGKFTHIDKVLSYINEDDKPKTTDQSKKSIINKSKSGKKKQLEMSVPETKEQAVGISKICRFIQFIEATN